MTFDLRLCLPRNTLVPTMTIFCRYARYASSLIHQIHRLHHLLSVGKARQCLYARILGIAYSGLDEVVCHSDKTIITDHKEGGQLSKTVSNQLS